MAWEYPGVGRYLVFMGGCGFLYLLLVFLAETGVFREILYFFRQRFGKNFIMMDLEGDGSLVRYCNVTFVYNTITPPNTTIYHRRIMHRTSNPTIFYCKVLCDIRSFPCCPSLYRVI